VNGDTVTLVHRPYGELVDDLLTAVVGGVVNEPLRFDVAVLSYPLAEPAAEVRSITGTARQAAHTFLAGIDWAFGPATNTISWLPDGTRPDDDTTFFVDYARRDSRSPLTDTAVGSVTRTLTEAIGREIAVVYQQIDLAYRSAFIESAEGASLDHVVAILGVTRKTAEFAEGLATFFRAAGLQGNITIPAGLPLTTISGPPAVFVVAAERTLQDGQQRIDVPVRADIGFAGQAGLVDRGAIGSMAQPVAGIDRVTNLDPTVRAAGDESDDQLRARALAVLASLGQATRAAVERVIREGRGVPVQFFDPNDPGPNPPPPGSFVVVVQAEPERLSSLRDQVHVTRAAGVLATLLARYVFITTRVAISITPGIPAPGRDRIRRDVVAALQAYVDGLTGGQTAQGIELLKALQVPDVIRAELRDVVVARADLASGDDAARIPDRSLLRSTAPDRAGQPASDADIGAGTFEVSATVDGEAWWIALDMSVADIGDLDPTGQG
jgi:hypothetical protein